ncbi:MAG: FlgO family outer membrane protein [Campylobacterota bacterium]|nr:FlgO family outer membrane protein [Campylobacterota bacterium]
MKSSALITSSLVLFALFGLSGCYQKVVSYNANKKETCFIKDEKRYALSDSRVHYQYLTDDAIDSIFDDIEPLPKEIIVTEFVDLTSLENQSKFGYVLSNSIKNSLANELDIDIIEAEVSKYFKLSGNGLKILSRDIRKIRTDNLNIKHAVAGTYTATESEVIVFVKLVNLETGLIEGSYSRTLPMNCAMLQLLKEK